MVKELRRIGSPVSLKSFTQKNLDAHSVEIRELLITAVSENGGHLGSDLGAVELAIALHRALHSVKDTIVWDVGY